MSILILDVPSLMSDVRSVGWGGKFMYNGKKITVTYQCCGEYVASDEEGNTCKFNDHNPCFKKYSDDLAEQRRIIEAKRRAKSEEQRKIREAKAVKSTMTAFEWRYKLATEHNLYLKRRQYGCGSFVVYEMKGSLPVSCIGENKGGKFFKDQEVLKYCENSWVCGYDAYKQYNDETIKDVLEKVKRAHEREKKRLVKETIKVLDVLD